MACRAKCRSVVATMTTTTALARQLEFVACVVDEIQTAAHRIGWRAHDNAQIFAICLHVTITELLAGCFVLAEKQQGTGIPILLRSMYEALVDLDNLLRDASYVGHLEAANLMQIEKLLKQAASGNPGLRGLGKKHDIEAARQRARADIEALKISGRSTLKISEKCKRVGRSDEYHSLYGLFCLDTHNNVAALLERHVSDVDSNTMISFFGAPDIHQIMSRVSFAAQFAIESARILHRAFKTDAPEPQALADQYWKERAGWGIDGETVPPGDVTA